MSTRDKEPDSILPKSSAADKNIASSETALSTLPMKTEKESLSPLREAMLRFRHNMRAMISLGMLVLMVLLAIVGPSIYKHIGGTYQADLGGTISPATYH